MRLIILTACLCLLGLTAAGLVRGTLLKSTAGNLRGLCEGKQVDLSTLQDLSKLVANLKNSSYEHSCDERTQRALAELGRMGADTNACTMEKAQDITRFADKYLANLNQENGDTINDLPKPLIRFALAYGMQVSNICQRHMIYKFSIDTYDNFWKSGDYHEVLRVTHKHGPLSRVLMPILRAGEMVLPSDLEAILPGLDEGVMTLMGKSKSLERMKELCEKRLQPLYEPILLPIAHLTRAGFSYQDLAFRRDLHFLYWLKERGRFWSQVVFLCELLKPVRMVDDGSGANDLSDEAITTAMNEATVEEHNSDTTGPEVGETPPKDVQSDAEEMKEPVELLKLRELKPVKPYVPNEIIGNKILGPLDFSLKSMIKSYDANMDATSRLQQMIMDRSYTVFKMMSKWGSHKPLIKKYLNSLVFSGSEKKELEEAKKGLLELLENKKRGSVAYAVANLGPQAVKLPVKAAMTLIGMNVAVWMAAGIRVTKGSEAMDRNLNKYYSVLMEYN